MATYFALWAPLAVTAAMLAVGAHVVWATWQSGASARRQKRRNKARAKAHRARMAARYSRRAA